MHGEHMGKNMILSIGIGGYPIFRETQIIPEIGHLGHQ